ncbi:hypothetical protein KA977_05510 [Candidatus Dependentiae bacterium]|nr:hypothetical protein [Candidatus Dependentiae bacterium]
MLNNNDIKLKEEIKILGCKPGIAALIIIVLIFISRMMSLLWFKPGGLTGNYTDYSVYYSIVKLSDMGALPFIHFWREYPPFNLYIMLWIYKISLNFSTAVFNNFQIFSILLFTVMSIIEAGTVAVLYLAGREIYNGIKPFTIILIYGILFYPIFVLNFSFDYIHIFFMMASLYLFIKEKYAFSFIIAGIGISSKIFPVLLIPVFFMYSPKIKTKILSVAIPLLIFFIILSPFLYANYKFIISFFAFLIKRHPWESIPALMNGYYSVGKALLPQYYFDSESYKILIIGFEDKYSIYFTLTAGLIILFTALRKPSEINKIKVVKTALFIISVFFAFSKGWSSQYILTVIPLIILCLPDYKGIIIILMLSIFNFLENPVYFNYFPEKLWILKCSVIGRFAVLCFTAVIAKTQKHDVLENK